MIIIKPHADEPPEPTIEALRKQAQDLDIADYNKIRRVALIAAIADPSTHGSGTTKRQADEIEKQTAAEKRSAAELERARLATLRTEREALIDRLREVLINDDNVPWPAAWARSGFAPWLLAEAQGNVEEEIALVNLLLGDGQERRNLARQIAKRALAENEIWDTNYLKWAPKQSYLIDGVLPRYGVGFLAGQYGSYKSFIALDMAAHLVEGRADWQGHPIVRGGSVIYVAAEGASGFNARTQAWIGKYTTEEDQQKADENGLPPLSGLSWYPRALNLSDREAIKSFAPSHKPRLIVIDTLAMCSGHLDLDTGHNATQLIANARWLAETKRCFVLVVAHLTEKSNSPTHILGSSGLEQGADAIWLVKTSDRFVTMTNTKMRDDSSQDQIRLSLAPHGDSLVVRSVDDFKHMVNYANGQCDDGDDDDLAVFSEARTMPEICELLDVSRSKADRLVKRLLDEGKIEPRTPRGKAFTYQAIVTPRQRHPVTM